ncbi:MAG: hypothetical protein ACJAZS_000842 [Alteromonas naphthalenivorans]|jgi:hypothetical protein
MDVFKEVRMKKLFISIVLISGFLSLNASDQKENYLKQAEVVVSNIIDEAKATVLGDCFCGGQMKVGNSTQLPRVKDKNGKASCGHIFHTKCIQQWAKTKPECPVCRAQFTAKDVGLKEQDLGSAPDQEIDLSLLQDLFVYPVGITGREYLAEQSRRATNQERTPRQEVGFVYPNGISPEQYFDRANQVNSDSESNPETD